MNNTTNPEGSTREYASPFPVDIFPTPLAKFVTEAAAALPCPMDFVAVPMLALLGAAIGTSRVLEIKPGWRARPLLWAAVVAGLGSKKSPALDDATVPLQARQCLLHTKYQETLKSYDPRGG